MKTINFLLSMSFLSLLISSCSGDDNNPEPVNEEEVITTMTVTLTPQEGEAAIILQSQDLDGDGPNAPVVTVSGNLASNTSYDGTIVLLNETETPAEDITEEVSEEAEDHQFFFNVAGGLDATASYEDLDGDGNPLGIEFTLSPGGASNGTLTITLRHEPKKPNDGSLADAGGETDIAQTFDLIIE